MLSTSEIYQTGTLDEVKTADQLEYQGKHEDFKKLDMSEERAKRKELLRKEKADK
jgi:hypothetical protein